MDTTGPPFDLPFPEGSDPADISQVGGLAQAVHDAIAALIIPGTGGRSLLQGTTQLGTDSPLSNALMSLVRAGNSVEFGHPNVAGYRSTFGCEFGSGKSFVAFNAEAGTNSNTYRTRGNKGFVIRAELDGSITFNLVPNANADNQTLTPLLTLSPTGAISGGIGEPMHVVDAGGQPPYEHAWATTAAVPAFYKSLGRVYLEGVATNATPSAATIFTLPAGYRPSRQWSPVGTGLTILANGEVRLLSAGTTAVFDGVDFRAA